MTVAPSTLQLSVGQCANLACLLEATAPKPGNVYRGADFEELTYLDFAISGAVIAAPLDAAAAGAGLGATVLAAVRATRQAVGTNTNLGTLLLLAPLAMVPHDAPLDAGVRCVLGGLTPEDSNLVYEAIRLARPGGLATVAEADIAGPAPNDLMAAMHLAAERDLVARQYTNGFAQVLGVVLPSLATGAEQGRPWADTIVRTHLLLLAEFADSLIARKCGQEIAAQATAWAGKVLAAGENEESYARELADFDFWLRADGHRRNPGTTADLVAAGLFAALRTGIIELPLRFYS